MSRKGKERLNSDATATSGRRLRMAAAAAAGGSGTKRCNSDEQKELAVSILGASKVGKTAMLCQYLYKYFPAEYTPTVENFSWIEYDHEKDELSSLKTFLLKIIDTSGSPEFGAMRDWYQRNSDAFVIVAAINDDDSFKEAFAIIEEIKIKNIKTAPILLAINKMDLFHIEDQGMNDLLQDGAKFAEDNHLLFIRLCSVEQSQVENAFKILLQRACAIPIREFYKRRQSMPQINIPSNFVNAKPVSAKQNNSKCLIS